MFKNSLTSIAQKGFTLTAYRILQDESPALLIDGATPTVVEEEVWYVAMYDLEHPGRHVLIGVTPSQLYWAKSVRLPRHAVHDTLVHLWRGAVVESGKAAMIGASRFPARHLDKVASVFARPLDANSESEMGRDDRERNLRTLAIEEAVYLQEQLRD